MDVPSSMLSRTEPQVATAIWFPAPRQVELREEVLPAVGPDAVRVRSVASGVSAGTEMLVYRGQVPEDLPLDLPTLQGSFHFPIKYGYATTGRVVECGDAVQALSVGDSVFVHHPPQTEFVVPATLPVRLPPDFPTERGVLLANLETAVNVMLDAHPRFGERLLIFGQGVVGLLLSQLAQRVGAAAVIAVEPIARRRKLASELGAITLSPDEDLPHRVRDLTDGRGADIVIEASGNPSAPAQALECVVAEGTIVVCSWYGTKPVQLPLGGAFHRGRLRLVSSQVGSLAPSLSGRWDRLRRTELAISLLSQLRLDELITQRVPFAAAAEAYELVDRHPEETVQVILTYGEQELSHG